MPSDDTRAAFFIDTIANLATDGNNSKKIQEQVTAQQAAVDTFLNDANCLVLTATVDSSGPSAVVHLATPGIATGPGGGIDLSSPTSVQVHFIKLRPEAITGKDIVKDVLVTSASGSPLQALYHQLHFVYAPAILRKGTVDEKTQQILRAVDSGLSNAIFAGMEASENDIHSEQSIASILTPSDEFEFWESLAGVSKYRECAGAFSDAFVDVSKRFGRFAQLTMAEVSELLEDTQNALDDVWKAPLSSNQYPQKRMAHLFEVVSKAVVRHVDATMPGDLWDGNSKSGSVKRSLQQAVGLCEVWVGVCEQLTSTFWSSFAEHPWVGPPYVPGAVVDLLARLDDILRVRTTHEELLRLMTPQEQEDMRVADTFAPFRDVRALQCNPYTQGAWTQAKEAYERLLLPIEEHISGKLRSQIAGLSDRPQQLLREFLKFNNLVSRRNISRQMQPERETLMAQLTTYVEQLDQDFDARSNLGAAEDERPPSGVNLPQVSNNIMWAQQVHSKAQEILDTAARLLGDLATFGDFKHVSTVAVACCSQRVADGIWLRVTAEGVVVCDGGVCCARWCCRCRRHCWRASDQPQKQHRHHPTTTNNTTTTTSSSSSSLHPPPPPPPTATTNNNCRHHQAVQQLLDKVRLWKKEEVDKWTEEVEDSMDDAALDLKGRVMEIKKGDLVVNYDERLVRLLREVRQLTELGCPVSKKIRAKAALAERYVSSLVVDVACTMSLFEL
jgi:dynein heavy chain 2